MNRYVLNKALKVFTIGTLYLFKIKYFFFLDIELKDKILFDKTTSFICYCKLEFLQY